MDSIFKDGASRAPSSLFSMIETDQTLNYHQSYSQPPIQTPSSSFPIIAVIILSIVAIAFLLLSYYIFVIKCCLNWQQLSPVLTHFSHTPPRRSEDFLMAHSPAVEMNRGLNEFLIRNIPTIQYKTVAGGGRLGDRSFRGCAVCLSEFQDQEMLRVLPRCSHAFHLDCIDVWLLNNASCPLCRSSISGRTKHPVIDRIIAPTSSPQELASHSSSSIIGGGTGDEDYVVIELAEVAGGLELQQRRRFDQAGTVTRDAAGLFHSQRKMVGGSGKKGRKFRHQATSIMGDECINVREKDEQFPSIQPIRRSFSMDSAVDRQMCLQVQEIVRRENRNQANEFSEGEESNNSGRVRRGSSFFTVGGGRRPRSAVLPVELNL